jgi:hypothetical protein
MIREVGNHFWRVQPGKNLTKCARDRTVRAPKHIEESTLWADMHQLVHEAHYPLPVLYRSIGITNTRRSSKVGWRFRGYPACQAATAGGSLRRY